jgi:hypothetical protein
MNGIVLGGSECAFPVQSTGQVSLRAPSPYIHLCHELAAALDVTAGTLLRRALEHYAHDVAAAEIGPDIPHRLISAGKRVRCLRRQKTRTGSSLPTLAS